MSKTPNILIERKLDRYCNTKDRQDICRVTAAYTMVMAASNDMLAENDDVLAASDGKNSNVR